MLSLEELQNKLKEKIIGQDEAVKSLSLVVYRHYLRRHAKEEFLLNLPSGNNVLLIGPTGTGKTTITNELGRLLDLPVIKINAKSIVQEGWAGRSLVELMCINKNPPNLFSIVVIDEFDKLMGVNQSTSGDTNERTQHSILTALDGALLDYQESESKKRHMADTRNMLFILSGAFQGLCKDATKQTPGFLGKKESEEESIYGRLEKYGMISEIAGRIKQVIEFNHLSKEDFVSVLKNKNFSLNQWLAFFYQLTIDKTPEIEYNVLAERAEKKGLGVRGLIQETEILIDQIILEQQEYLNYRFQEDPIKKVNKL